MFHSCPAWPEPGLFNKIILGAPSHSGKVRFAMIKIPRSQFLSETWVPFDYNFVSVAKISKIMSSNEESRVLYKVLDTSECLMFFQKQIDTECKRGKSIKNIEGVCMVAPQNQFRN